MAKQENIARFIPGRKPIKRNGKTDDRLLLPSARFGNHILRAPNQFEAGVLIGPDMQEDPDNPELIAGGKIVPAIIGANDDFVREFTFNDQKGNQITRYFVDQATFDIVDGWLRAIPLNEENTFYIESWTGDLLESMNTVLRIQSGVFQHGSVPLTDLDLMLNATSLKPVDLGKGLAATGAAAELRGEILGPSIGGVPFWLTRLWKLRYTQTHSDVILVRQLSRYFQVFIRNGKAAYNEVAAKEFEKKFLDLSAKECVAKADAPTVALAA